MISSLQFGPSQSLLPQHPCITLCDQRKTLDIRHTNLLRTVQDNCDTLVTLKNTRDDLAKKLILMRNDKSRNEWTDEDFHMFGEISECIHEMSIQIDDMENNSNENEYYLRTAPILYDYYNIISGNPTALTQSSSKLLDADDKKNNILTYFNKITCIKKPDISDVDDKTQLHDISESLFDEDLQPSYQSNDDRATLLDRYIQCANTEGPLRHLHGVDKKISRTNSQSLMSISSNNNSPYMNHTNCADQTICSHCHSSDFTTLLHEGCVTCNKCFTVEYIIVDHDKPSYKDPPKEMAYFAYKRINHLNEWLNQVQGKETTEIPEDIFISIIIEIKKQKITNMATLTKKKIKDILKKLKINKYYEHIPHIIHRLNGIPTPHMTPELEDKIRHMFCMIQIPFLKYSPATRKNFLSYSYCLHKMMQLLEKDQYLESFPLLKSREKLHQQDQIWKKICEDIGWDFIPSL